MPDFSDVSSRVYGLESALAERQVRLMDKLSRCSIVPYALYASTTALAQNDETDLALTDLYNDQSGPMVITRVRVYTSADPLTAEAAVAPFSNVALRVSDPKRGNVLTKDPVLLPVLASIRDNSWLLDRPYVLFSTHGLFVQATEQDINGTTLLFVSFLGEAVLGDMTGPEVEEAIALGVYPLPGRQTSIWDQALLYGGLFGPKPPRLKGEAADILDDLRKKAARLREMLRDASYNFYALVSNSNNITRNATTAMSRENFRIDQGGPFAVSRIRTRVGSSLAASAALALFESVAFSIEAVDERVQLTKLGVPILGPCLFSRSDNTWSLEHPYILGKNGSFQVNITEQDINATTDVFVSFLGETVYGMKDTDLRAAVALGLYPLMERARS